jgi:hypothetical protein
VTTVHDRQVLEAGAVDPDAHDVPIDVVCTPTRTLRVDEPGPKPSGIDWDRIDEERLGEIPGPGPPAGRLTVTRPAGAIRPTAGGTKGAGACRRYAFGPESGCVWYDRRR